MRHFLRKNNYKFIDRFKKNESGSILPIAAVFVLILVVISGAAVDITRAVSEREKLAHALDASALALATRLSSVEMDDDEIREFLEGSLRANLLGAATTDDAIANIAFEIDEDEGTVLVSSNASVGTYFTSIGGLGPETFDVGTFAEVSFSNTTVELAMVLDVTGSMGGKIGALRDAANSMVDILLPAEIDPDDSKVRISLVPYAEGVNLGSYASTVTQGSSTSDNCVSEREGAQGFTDAVYNYAGANSEFFIGGVDYWVYDDGSSNSWYTGQDYCPDSEVVPLTADHDVLENAIDDLEANGGTGGQVGIAWGWYTISPRWASLWPTDSDPLAYSEGTNLKFALIMTDGVFNADFTRMTTDCDGGCAEAEYAVEWYTANPSMSDAPATRAVQLCDAMSDEGVEVFAIYFDTGGSGYGDTLMSRCASSSDNYYLAENSSDLEQAFAAIARKIQRIYISK